MNTVAPPRHLLAGALLVAAALATLLVGAAPGPYTATALVVVDAPVEAEVALLRSRAVAEGVVDRLGSASRPHASGWGRRARAAAHGVLARAGLVARRSRREQLVDDVGRSLVVTPRGGGVLALAVSAGGPEAAAEVAGAVVDVWKDLRRQVTGDGGAAALAARLVETERDLERVRAAIRRQADRKRLEALALAARALERSYLYAHGRLERVRLAHATQGAIRLVDPPTVRAVGVSRRARVLVVLAALATLAAALVRARRAGTVRDPEDVATLADLPVLGSVRRASGRTLRALRLA